MNNNESDIEPTLDLTIKKKKSKSIDIFSGKSKSVNLNHSTSKIELKKSKTNDQGKKDSNLSGMYKKKASFDLTSSS